MDYDQMLNVYIQDYLVKRKYKSSAKAFQREAQLPTNTTAIDAPGGFLFEWWSVFWDMFIARYKGTDANHKASVARTNEIVQHQRQQLSSEQQMLQQLQLQLHQQQAYNLNKEDSSLQIRKDILSDMDHCISRKTPSFDTRASGSNLAGNTSPLKGWPLVGLDQLQPGFSYQRKYHPQTHQPSQLQLRQQIRALLPGQSTEVENDPVDSHWNLDNNDLSSFFPGHVRLPISSGGDTFLSQLQKSNCSQQLSMQTITLGPLSEISNFGSQQLDSTDAARSSPGDVSISNSSRDHDQADVDIAVNKGSVEDDVDSFISCDELEAGRTSTRMLNEIQEVTFSEIATIHANRAKFCDLSIDGKAIATGGDDNKAVLWCTESRQEKFVLEHSGAVTDICFGPRLPRIATSSLDRTVKIWNIADSGCPLRTFEGHSSSVLSLDFHPKREDLVCSCDDADSIRYWSIKNGSCTGMLTSCATQVRFEPASGRYLAACVENGVSIIDVETMQTYKYPLEGHATEVFSVCWNPSGDYLASISEDAIKVWKIGSWGLGNCIRELSIRNKRFHCCIFHPCHSSLLVLGSDESLELWDMAENKITTAFGQPTVNLAASKPAGLVASVSDGNVIKLWK